MLTLLLLIPWILLLTRTISIGLGWIILRMVVVVTTTVVGIIVAVVRITRLWRMLWRFLR